uniref:HepT-like ribonuclease domain-containing protein n=1 Tax=Halomonas sp. TaxID=1486246 RepID=UPI00261B3DCC|nr:HepT-like ribonuclease domain-containing protein [Halomonas sp.]
MIRDLALGQPVPVSAYDAFATLARHQQINTSDFDAWNAAIGLRNRIVHDDINPTVQDCLNLDMTIEQKLVRQQQYHFIRDDLMALPDLC